MMCALVFLAGCVGGLPKGNETGPAAGSGLEGSGGGAAEGQGSEAVANPVSAKSGLNNAKGLLPSYIKDASLVSVSGACGNDGKTVDWQYSFDSYAKNKNFVVTISGETNVRETLFTFSNALGDNWIDSDAAVRACGKSGACSIEMKDSSPVWTIIYEGGVCEVNALNGEFLG